MQVLLLFMEMFGSVVKINCAVFDVLSQPGLFEDKKLVIHVYT